MSKPAPKAEALLKLDHISLTLDGNPILRDISVEVDTIGHGQVIGFLGPSGMGKTQLSRVIAGLQEPTSGQVLIGEKLEPVRAGRVGMVPQNYLLFKWTSVLNNLLIAGRQAGWDKRNALQRAQHYMERFGLSDAYNKYPCQLSGGMRQRVAIIRQLMCSEHFLIMDEPFSGLDLIMKKRACDLIAEIAGMDGLNTIIIVTHDVTEAVTISDRIWMLGHEKNEEGKYIPGARLVENYDVAAEGLSWHADIQTRPEFQKFVSKIKERFATLKQF